MNSFAPITLPLLPPCRFKRWLATITAVLLTTLGLTAIAPAAQAAPTEATATVFSVPGWDYANVRSGPSTDKAVVKTIPAGSTVTLGCSTHGSIAAGPYGASNLWYKVSGTDTYIADVMVLTGSDEAVTGACTETEEVPAPAPKPATPSQNYNRSAAVQWAHDNVRTAPRFESDCTWFVSQALWAGGLPKSSDWTSNVTSLSIKKPYLLQPRAATGADYLKNYLVNDTGMATITELKWSDNTAGGAQPGDIIAYDWNSGADGVIDHLAIVTGSTPEGYPLVSQHTPAQYDRYWSYSESGRDWIENAEKGARVYLIHIAY